MAVLWESAPLEKSYSQPTSMIIRIAHYVICWTIYKRRMFVRSPVTNNIPVAYHRAGERLVSTPFFCMCRKIFIRTTVFHQQCESSNRRNVQCQWSAHLACHFATEVLQRTDSINVTVSLMWKSTGKNKLQCKCLLWYEQKKQAIEYIVW